MHDAIGHLIHEARNSRQAQEMGWGYVGIQATSGAGKTTAILKEGREGDILIVRSREAQNHLEMLARNIDGANPAAMGMPIGGSRTAVEQQAHGKAMALLDSMVKVKLDRNQFAFAEGQTVPREMILGRRLSPMTVWVDDMDAFAVRLNIPERQARNLIENIVLPATDINRKQPVIFVYLSR